MVTFEKQIFTNHRNDYEKNKEYNDKKVSIVENIKNKTIDLYYDSTSETSNARRISTGFKIVLNGHIPYRTGCDHELAHIKEDSLNDSVWKGVAVLSRYALKKYGNKDNYYQKQFVYEVILSTYNIMEDIRIESIDGYVFVGRRKSYETLCKREGERMKPDDYSGYVYSPPNKLLAKRFFREDLIPDDDKKEINSIYEQCQHTTTKGCLKVMKKWIDGSLGKWIEQMLADITNKENDSVQKSNEVREKRDRYSELSNEREEAQENMNSLEKHMSDIGRQLKDETLELSARKDMEEELDKLHEKKLVVMNQIESMTKELVERDDVMQRLYGDIHETQRDITRPQEMIKAIEDLIGDIKGISNNRKEQIMNGLQDGTVDKIIESMEKIDHNKEKAKTIKRLEKEKLVMLAPNLKPVAKLNPYLHACNIIPSIKNELKTIISTIKNRSERKLEEEGDMLDVEAMIDEIKKGGNRFFEDDRIELGTEILIGIDCSGSMITNDRLTLCRDLMFTMFESIERYPKIKLTVVTFGGSTIKNKPPAFRVIKNKQDCKFISVDDQYPLTPTHEAIEYCGTLLHRMKGKRIFLFLTDGEPANANNTHKGLLYQLARQKYNKVKKIPNIVCKPIGIYMGWGLEEIFGNDALYLRDKEAIQSFIRKEFKNAIKKEV